MFLLFYQYGKFLRILLYLGYFDGNFFFFVQSMVSSDGVAENWDHVVIGLKIQHLAQGLLIVF